MRRVLAVAGLLVALAASVHAEDLKPGYVVCESGGQLRWFLDLQDLGALSPSHPQPWQVQMHLDGGVRFRDQAREAYANGWCRRTSDLTGESMQVLENCDKEFPYPNGGCRKVRAQGVDWYTFGDALVSDLTESGPPATGSVNSAQLENLNRFLQSEPLRGGAGWFGPSIQFDTKGVDFEPWVRAFIARIKRNWFIPYSAMIVRGHVVLTFNVHRDGSMTDLTVLAPSEVETFTHAAHKALLASNPTRALPPEYPADKVFFTVTFYYNETPPEQATPVFRSAPVSEPDVPSAVTVEDTIEGLTQSDVRARFGHPNGVEVDPNGVTTWYYERPSQPTLKIHFVGGRASTRRPR